MQIRLSFFEKPRFINLSLHQLNESTNKTKKGFNKMKTTTTTSATVTSSSAILITALKVTAILVFAIFFTAHISAQYSQQWASALNSPGNKTSVIKDGSNNLYTFGGNTLAKFNSAGTLVWSTSTEYISAMAMDASGNIYVTGGYSNYPNGSIFIKKFNNNGAEVMSKVSSGGYNYVFTPVDIITDNNGNIFVYTSYFVNGMYHSNSSRLFKFDSSGNEVLVINPSGLSPVKMKTDNAGNLLLISYTYSYYGYFPAYTNVARYSPSGSLMNYLMIDSTGPKDLFTTGSGEIYLTGNRTVKINSGFAVEWEIINTFYGESVKCDNSGNVFVTGNTGYISSSSNVITQKLSAAGQLMWSQVYDSPVNGEDFVYDLLITPNGSILITGTTEISSGNQDMFLIKYSNSGGFMNSNFYNDMTEDESKQIILFNGNDVVLCGLSGSGYSFDKVTLVKFSDVTAITPQNNQVPGGFSLSQNYPNPFNPSTKISFSLPKASFVKMAVYDVTGKEVETLVNENMNAGSFEVDFNASKLTSGIYFCRITAGEFTDVKKMMLVK